MFNTFLKLTNVKIFATLAVLLLNGFVLNAQVNGSFTVAGDIDRFYPVTFTDGGWDDNVASELELGRSTIHINSSWRGSLIAKFQYHTTRWGNLSNFIHSDFKQKNNGYNTSVNFIAGYTDVTGFNDDNKIIIWLKGGGTTYYFRSKFAIAIKIYDGVANPYPFQEINGSAHTFKTTVDNHFNSDGITYTGSAYFNGVGNSYFNGSIGIGTKDTKGYKLAVAGSVIAESIKIQLQGSWPDFVFKKGYLLPSLNTTEKQIKLLGHLPNMPSAIEVKANGIDLSEMNIKLVRKIEELTLYLIKQDKDITILKNKVKHMEMKKQL